MRRFWNRVDIREPSECWPWLGAVGSDGYGKVWFQGKMQNAHRVAYKLEHPEENIDGLHIHHKDCVTTLCCNLGHLESHHPLTHGEVHQKTHCLHGHEFTKENTYIDSQYKRHCRECDRLRKRKRNLVTAEE